MRRCATACCKSRCRRRRWRSRVRSRCRSPNSPVEPTSIKTELRRPTMALEVNGQNADDEQVAGAEHTRTTKTYRPNVDILEGQDELVVLADMPGVKSEDIDIDFKEGVLTLHGRVE